MVLVGQVLLASDFLLGPLLVANSDSACILHQRKVQVHTPFFIATKGNLKPYLALATDRKCQPYLALSIDHKCKLYSALSTDRKCKPYLSLATDHKCKPDLTLATDIKCQYYLDPDTHGTCQPTLYSQVFGLFMSSFGSAGLPKRKIGPE